VDNGSIPDVVKSSKKVLLVLIQWIYTLDSTTQSLKNKGPVLQQNAMQFHNLLKGNGDFCILFGSCEMEYLL